MPGDCIPGTSRCREVGSVAMSAVRSLQLLWIQTWHTEKPCYSMQLVNIIGERALGNQKKAMMAFQTAQSSLVKIARFMCVA